MFATLRKKRTRLPFAETSMLSLALLPLNCRTSLPFSPSTTSLPSPGSHWNVSLPPPRRAVSTPWLPSTRSLPPPPRSVSAPEPPTSVSLPAPPWIVMASGIGPPMTRTSSSPAPAATSTAVKVLRSTVKSDVPSMPTSTWSVLGEPPRNVSRSLSLAPLPAIVSVPASTLTV